MNTDLSVAPEIARLADPFVPAQHAAAVPRTDGRIAGDLADLAATPQRWWDLVRFDSAGPARIPVPDAPGTWLLVLPPGATADCDCEQATALAGEAVEAAGPRPAVDGHPWGQHEQPGARLAGDREADGGLRVEADQVPPALRGGGKLGQRGGGAAVGARHGGDLLCGDERVGESRDLRSDRKVGVQRKIPSCVGCVLGDSG